MRILGVDPNPEMVPYAEEAAHQAGLATEQLQVMDGAAEHLPVASQSQDAVVCTLVSAPDHSIMTAACLAALVRHCLACSRGS